MKKTNRFISAIATALLIAVLFASCKAVRTDKSSNAISGTDYEKPPVYSNEEYLEIKENAERQVADSPLLTFSLKVDTASYRNIARYLNSGVLPPADAVRIEEMINYFRYDTPLQPGDDVPFAVYTEIGPSPFSADNEIAFVRVKTNEIDRTDLPRSNLTFLIDSSGSMMSADKLPLLQQAFGLLAENLTENDVVSLVTYAGSAATLLDSVSGNQTDRILDAISSLEASGSTAGAEGIKTAYALTRKNFIPGANNRVILATDGDFNVGVSSLSDLEALIRKERESGIYLTILGVGTENLKDNRMETIAKNGNGNYSYLDTVREAQKVLVDEMGANLYTIADDVKAQIEFNPALIESYRLIGYENRLLSDRDFNDDTKDAGEIGVGTDVILMFEITRKLSIDLKYQPAETSGQSAAAYSDELFTVSIRYKDPGKSVSKLISVPVKTETITDFPSSDFRFAVSVAAFGHLLRDSEYKGSVTAALVLANAKDSLGEDKDGYRKEFISLVEKYIAL